MIMQFKIFIKSNKILKINKKTKMIWELAVAVLLRKVMIQIKKNKGFNYFQESKLFRK